MASTLFSLNINQCDIDYNTCNMDPICLSRLTFFHDPLMDKHDNAGHMEFSCLNSKNKKQKNTLHVFCTNMYMYYICK